MDFTLGEELTAVRDLASEIFTDTATTERVRAVESTGMDEKLWHSLAEAGLLGIALPEVHGGAGLGMGGLCVVLEEQGKRVAPVPLWPSAVAALVLAAHGSEQQRELLSSVADGSARLTLALEEFGAADPASPECVAERAGSRWSLTGNKASVPVPEGARAILVSATGDEGARLFLVDPAAPGLSWEAADTTSHQPCGHLRLDGAPAHAVGEPAALHDALHRAYVALAAVQLGVAEGALRHAASYLSERKQFGRPLATFQAVAHQLADCYIDIEAMSVTMWNAATHLDAGEPAERVALVAKWWATDAGQQVVHRVQHLHGGIGVDIDYPVHRHYLWGKQIAGTLGGPSADLARLGSVLATTEVTTA
ncbi:acyl-CoA dehydrogenase [Saccharomonospora amisosensis]|uniref:Acyl-CoA dehydrogenase n=1 Tax=Saccharomonospora amisosensis TaxID=1128677 RepID=A0A7X5URI9_9PSEU|nr:acyl-CoA dehydrogenase family protein [Saccharomonospora amisosensis]NIJ12903.1 acyl-CoA dehydrogenase [Saccharomonospora amisosensis]